VKDFLALMNPTRWAVLAGVLGGLLFALGVAGLHIHAEGKATGAAEVQAAWDAHENDLLRTQAREIARLIAVNQEVQSDYNVAIAEVDSLRADRAVSASLRAAERRSIADAASRATAAACGRYAEAAERDIAVVEDDAERLGHEAARASAAAHALRSSNEALMRFSMPRSPFTKETP